MTDQFSKREIGILGILAGVVFVLVVQAAPASAAFFTQSFHPNVLSVSMTPPIASLPAATSTGSVASSTIYFSVTALDAVGNQTTAGNQLATTTLSNAGFELTWNAIAGATGYNIWFSTTTPATFLQYFSATTSGAYDFTSTSSPVYSTGFPTSNGAYAVNISSSGQSFVYGGNGTATSTNAASTTALTISGGFIAQSPATTTNCYASTVGVIFFNTSNGHMWGCSNAGIWVKLF